MSRRKDDVKAAMFYGGGVAFASARLYDAVAQGGGVGSVWESERASAVLI